MSCEICGKTTNLKSCGGCFKVNYCSKDHQVAHWKDHKLWCTANKVSSSTDATSAMVIGQQTQTSDGTGVFGTPENCLGDQVNQVDFSNTCISDDECLPSTSHVNASPLSNNFSQTNFVSNAQASNFNNSQVFPSSEACDISNVNASNQNPYIDPSPFSNIVAMTSQYILNREVLNNLIRYCHIILKDMNQYGFCVIDDFLQNGDQILGEVIELYQRGLFSAGQVVNNRANSNSQLIRGDQITWIDGSEERCNNIGFLIRVLDSIITRCCSMSPGEMGQFANYRINRRTKAMIACYPGNNTKYVRHVDNPNNDGRCITSIYYLNKDYERERDGGVLRLFPTMNDGIVADIEPRFNRVIFFWSDRRNPHEVMPSSRMRFAITVWYLDYNERERAIQQYKENNTQFPIDKDLSPF